MKAIIKIRDNVNIDVDVAESLKEKYQGLSGRDSLCEMCGMFFPYERAEKQTFVMRGMKFPLDFIFIREGQVVETVANVEPPKASEPYAIIRSGEAADMVLEVNSGFIEKHKVIVGDRAVRVDLGK